MSFLEIEAHFCFLTTEDERGKRMSRKRPMTAELAESKISSLQLEIFLANNAAKTQDSMSKVQRRLDHIERLRRKLDVLKGQFLSETFKVHYPV